MTAPSESLQLAREYPPPREQYHIDRLIDRLRVKMATDYAERRMLRDAHPKMHGCVKGEFVVEPGLDGKLRHGIFREPRSYPAWIRFSNQNNVPQADWNKDIRGVAVKLMGVEGEKLLTPDANTQDFILISHDNFVTKDVAEFDGLTAAVPGGILGLGWFFFNPFNAHWRAYQNLMASLQRHDSLLNIDYFSVSPYLLGPHAVKYKLAPLSSPASPQPLPRNPTDDYLREGLVEWLKHREATFKFQVQLQVDAERMPIEDVSRSWDTRLSDFQTVATLKIPPQEFDFEQRREFGDNLSFNPWRCLTEHRPLGGVNRARRQVYQTLSEFRHERNQAPLREPAADDASDS